MLESGWLFVGGVAVLATAAAVLTTDDGVAIVAGVAGALSWGIWSFGTLNVEVVDGAGGTITFTSPALTLLGVAFALLPLFVALTGPVALVDRARGGASPEDL